jgi:ABC-type phosphate transport system substrate-binding protein
MFVEHSIFKMLGKYINNQSLKKRYKSARTFDEFVNIFKDPVFTEHVIYLNSFFNNYNEIKQIYSKLKGLIGYVFYGNVTMPIHF